MRNQQNGRRRGRGGPRPPQQGGIVRPDLGNRGGDNRGRGNAAQMLEKYKTLARDATQSGDRITAEYYLQFADHYFRVLSENRPRFEERPQQRQSNWNDGADDARDADSSGNEEEDARDTDRSWRGRTVDQRDRAQGEAGQRAPAERGDARPDRDARQDRNVRFDRNARPEREARPDRDQFDRARDAGSDRFARPDRDARDARGDGDARSDRDARLDRDVRSDRDAQPNRGVREGLDRTRSERDGRDQTRSPERGSRDSREQTRSPERGDDRSRGHDDRRPGQRDRFAEDRVEADVPTSSFSDQDGGSARDASGATTRDTADDASARELAPRGARTTEEREPAATAAPARRGRPPRREAAVASSDDPFAVRRSPNEAAKPARAANPEPAVVVDSAPGEAAEPTAPRRRKRTPRADPEQGSEVSLENA